MSTFLFSGASSGDVAAAAMPHCGQGSSLTTPYARHWSAMSIDLDKMAVEELVALNQRIVERLKFLESVQTYQEMMAFNLGARVSFEAPGEGRQLATLVKFNRKTVTVMTDRGQRWNISPHLLSEVKEAAPRPSLIYAGERRLK